MNKYLTKLTTYAAIFSGATAMLLVGITIFAIARLIVNQASTLISKGQLDLSYLALLIVTVFILTAGQWSYFQWNTRRTFIFVAPEHDTVVPAERRDEYFELEL